MLKQISIEQTGLIDLTDLFNSFSKSIRIQLYSPILAFYNISRKIEKNLKFSSLEFIYKNNLNLTQELSINEFFSFIAEPLNLDDTSAKNVFKCLDYSNKKSILVSNFIVVIDSYRQDYIDNIYNEGKLEDEKNPEKSNKEGKDSEDISEVKNKSNGNYNLTDSQMYWINKFLQITESQGLTSYMVFNISASDSNANELVLDNLKKKLKIVLPSSLISAGEITHITDAFNVNNNGIINFEDYSEILEICKLDPIFSTSIPNMNSTSVIKKDEIKLKKLRIKNKNIHHLPVRGNTRALELVSSLLYSKENPNPQSEDQLGIQENDPNKLERHDSRILTHENNISLKEIEASKNSLKLMNKNFIKNFVKEMDVFQNGEWIFIDILEDILIEKNSIPVYSVYNNLQEKLSPSISKKTIFTISKFMDSDFDGFVSYNDIIDFLLNNLNHTSVKLALKEIARFLTKNNQKISTEEFFKENSIRKKDEFNSSNFIKLISDNFKLPELVTKKLYFELKQLSKRDFISCATLIDMIDEFRLKFYSSKIEQSELEDHRKNKGINAGNNFIDKNIFDSEMKKLVKYLQRCFSCIKNEYFNNKILKTSLFKENLIKFIDLPVKISLQQYREKFINSLEVNLSIGIALYNETKNITYFKNSKNDADKDFFNSQNIGSSVVEREDLINLLTCYFDPTIENFEIELIVNLIERNFSPFKCCFELVEYLPNGLILFDLIKIFEKYFPRISKQILLDILKHIDSDKTGVLEYKNINQFLIKFSKNYKFSSDLFFKEISAIIDKTKLPTFEYLIKEAKFSNIYQLNDKINYYEHNAFFFEKMKFNFELSDFIFVYLSENSSQGNLKKQNEKFNFYGEEGYSFDKLVKNIDFYRMKIPENKKILKKKFVRTIENTMKIDKIYEDEEKLKRFFGTLNEKQNVGNVFNGLFVSDYLSISVYELFRLLKNEYKEIVAADSAIKFLKILDKEKKGFIKYKNFYELIKENELVDISLIVDLQIRYLAIKINKEYKANFENFFNFKNTNKNEFLTNEEFKLKFNLDFFKDDILMKTFFEKIKETKGKYSNMLSIQNFNDYLLYQMKTKTNSDLLLRRNPANSNENEDNYLTEDQKDITLFEEIKKSENFIEIFLERIDMKEASKLGKIDFDQLTKIFNENFENIFSDSFLKILFSKFSSIDKKFDLFKFLEWFELKFHKFSKDEITNKCEKSISDKIFAKDFLARFNTRGFSKMNLYEFVILTDAMFSLEIFQSSYSFILLLNSENNVLSNQFKANFDLFFYEFNLENKFLQIEKGEQKEEKIDKFVIITLIKLANFLDTLKSKLELFKAFDTDNDGSLNKSEFSTMLKRCSNVGITLNESQVNSITNIADTNKDGVINYIEFIEFENKIKEKYRDIYKDVNPAVDSNEKKDLDINEILKDYSNLTGIKNLNTKYETDLLKENYRFNLTNFSYFDKIEIDNRNRFNYYSQKDICLILFYIQEEFIENFNKFIFNISDLTEKAINVFELKEVFQILEKFEKLKDLLNEENKENLWNLSMKNLQNSTKNKLILDKAINVKTLITTVMSFKIEVESIKHKDKAKLWEAQYEIFGTEAKNELAKRTIMNSMSTKKRMPLQKNANFPFGGKDKKKDLNMIQDSDEKIINDARPRRPLKRKNEKKDNNQTSDKNETDKKIKKVETMLNKKKENNLFINSFKKNIDKVLQNEYDYEIVPERDYFKRPNGKYVETILNSETAAIKKCELIFKELKGNEKFFDVHFGSQKNDGGLGNRNSLYINGNPPKGAFNPAQVEWYRMEEICPDDNPLFIADGADSNDVIQGCLGDCWFISALSVLATKDHLLRGEFNEHILEDGVIDEEENVMLSTGCYPPIFHCFRIKNLFCFRFFKDFKWRYVIIDDRIPCRKVSRNQIPRPIYARCKSDNEFWVPLIEKAYAKLHENYDSLISGFIDEGLVDLTGFTARKKNIGPEQIKNKEESEKLWKMLQEYSSLEYETDKDKKKDRHGKDIKSSMLKVNNSMMGVSIDAKTVECDVVYNGSKCGLLARHAYSILDTFEISKPSSFKSRKKSRLLRIRNPWGTKEWNGKWSDQSEELRENQEK